MVLSSSTYQNLYKKIKQIMKESTVPVEEIPLLYMSQNKILAFEDCIQFTPQLFRLTKSIVVSEPLISFKDLLKQRLGNDAYAMPSARAGSIQNHYLKERIQEIQRQKAE